MSEPVAALSEDSMAHSSRRHALQTACAILLLLLLAATLVAQTKGASVPDPAVRAAPATDSATQASPLTAPAATSKPDDTATQASPMPTPAKGESIPADATLQVSISQALDSGRVHNGEHIRAVLKNPIRTSTGRVLPVNTEVEVTVLGTEPAGKLESSGEITLQVTRVDGIETISDVVTRRGTTGPRDLPDSAPAKGTDAILPAGTDLLFQIPTLPNPTQ